MAATVTAFDLNLLGLAEATKKTLSDPEVLIWRRKFGHLPDDLFLRAVDLAIDGCEFFPTPREFAGCVEAAQSPEERAGARGLVAVRGWLANGAVPVNWDAGRLAAARAALGLAPPSAGDLAYLTAERAAAGLPAGETVGALGAGR